MVDVVDRKKRSQMMAGIRGKDTRPELLVRKGLHRLGFRYGLHHRGLPGRPDLVFRTRQAVIFINGCFWHGHDCHLFKWPSTRSDWWQDKINGTKKRDQEAIRALQGEGWRVLTVWECSLKGKTRLPLTQVIQRSASWLGSNRKQSEIHGTDCVQPRKKK